MTDTINEWLRALVILIALGSVVALALWLHNDAASGGLLALLAAGSGFLFRGRVQAPGAADAELPGVMGRAGKPQA